MKKFNNILISTIVLLLISNTSHAEVVVLQTDSFVGLTFWVVSMGCLAATGFFFLERNSVATGWKTPITVAGLITGIAFIHYMYVRSVYVQTDDASILYRYVDWLITVPMQVIEFYLILAAVRKVPTIIFWKLLAASIIMIGGWYLGEAGHINAFGGFVIGMVGWIYILYEIYSGDAGRIAGKTGNRPLATAFNSLRMIVTIGWAIYPLGYIFGFMTQTVDVGSLNVIYNLADFVNKIAFGIVIWVAATANTR